MDQQKIGAFLKVLRKQKGLTQEQIAEKFNVSSRTVSRWENGINLHSTNLAKLWEHKRELGVSEKSTAPFT